MSPAVAVPRELQPVIVDSGLVPVSYDALDRAIELNGVAIDQNRRAFAWGRLACLRPELVDEHLAPPVPVKESLEAMIDRRARYLSEYQDTAYADRYRSRVFAVRQIEVELFGHIFGIIVCSKNSFWIFFQINSHK